MRRRIAFVICFILVASVFAGLFSYSRAAVDYTYVRVKLSIGTPASFSFLVDGNYSVSGQALERQLYTVRIDGSQLKLCLGNTTVAQDSTITITRHQGTDGRNNMIWLNNSEYGYRQYLGDMSFSIQNGAIQLVNRIHMEEYLYGVVPYEMSDSFPPEALKSQAVAARNYAARAISSSGTYDLTDLSSRDQVYKGYDASLSNAIAAVNATAGRVMKSGDRIIDAYYSASNGGMTDIPYHRWGGGADWTYYDIQPDPYDLANPESPFETIFLPTANLEYMDGGAIYNNARQTSKPSARVNVNTAIAYIKQLILDSGQLSSHGVTSINDFLLSGVTSLAAHTYDTRKGQNHSLMPVTGVNNCIDMVAATGSFTVTLLINSEPASADMEPVGTNTAAIEPTAASEPTAAPEPTATPEQTEQTEQTTMPEPTAAPEHTAAPEPGGADLSHAGTSASAMNVGDTVQVTGIELSLLALNGSDGTSTYKAFVSTSLGVVAVEPVLSDSTLVGFNLSRRRYGHGCGLSQRGAQQRAKDPDPNVSAYDKILAFYYPGITLASLETSAPSLPAALPSAGYTNGQVVNVTTSVNVRKGPSTSNSLLGTLPAGARLELMEGDVASDWYMFSYGGAAAYIHKSYVKQDTDTLVSAKFIRRRGEIYISSGTTCSDLIASLKGYSGTVTIRDASGTVVSGSAQVRAGYTITLTDGGGNTLDRVTARLMKGDVDGDGLINVSDYTQIRLHILRMITLDDYGVQMADINGDGAVDIIDYTLLRLYLLGLWNIV